MRAGETWAYRARRKDPLVQVELIKIGTRRPSRVLIEFNGDEFEGRREWVPPVRLKTLWAHVDDFRTREARWAAVTTIGLPAGDPREYAAEIIFDELIDGAHATFGYAAKGGIIVVADVAGLAEFLQIPTDLLTSHQDAFFDDGLLIAPWDTAELVVKTAAGNDPWPVLSRIKLEERRTSREAIHGRHHGGVPPHFIEPEDCTAFDENHGRPTRALLRKWCADEVAARFDEATALREEICRVDGLAREAIELLSRSRPAAAKVLLASLDGGTSRADGEPT